MAHGYGRRFSNNSKLAAANGGHVKRKKLKPKKHKTKPLCNSCGLSSESMVPLCQLCYYTGSGTSEDRIRFEHVQEKAEKDRDRKSREKGISESKLKRYDLIDRTAWLKDNVILVDNKFRVTSNAHIPELYVEVINNGKQSKKYFMKNFRQFVTTFLEGKRKSVTFNSGYITRKPKKNKKRKNPVYHIWTGKDTLCNRFASGEFVADNFIGSDSPDEGRVCKTCMKLQNKPKNRRKKYV
tara:strand:- start:70 stop:786 length:717 start_codon:yes stop_codon:yes gene_type:complete